VFDVPPARLLPRPTWALHFKSAEQAEELRKWLASSVVIAEMMRDQLPSDESDDG
jgi:hypothetical protein